MFLYFNDHVQYFIVIKYETSAYRPAIVGLIKQNNIIGIF